MPPAAAQMTAGERAASTYLACLERAIELADDRISDAATIATGARSVCREEGQGFLHASGVVAGGDGERQVLERQKEISVELVLKRRAMGRSRP
jgi:hypothetical protein